MGQGVRKEPRVVLVIPSSSLHLLSSFFLVFLSLFFSKHKFPFKYTNTHFLSTSPTQQILSQIHLVFHLLSHLSLSLSLSFQSFTFPSFGSDQKRQKERERERVSVLISFIHSQLTRAIVYSRAQKMSSGSALRSFSPSLSLSLPFSLPLFSPFFFLLSLRFMDRDLDPLLMSSGDQKMKNESKRRRNGKGRK